MQSLTPKPLHHIVGRTLLSHVMVAARASGASDLAVVVGPEQDSIAAEVSRIAPDAEIFIQRERLGTAHAVLSARKAIERGSDDILVMFSDTPLVQAATLTKLRATIAKGAAVAVLGFTPADPGGYGRLIVRGVFERFRNIKFVGCHLGGGICDVIGRMDYAYELGDLASGLGPYEPLLITKPPSEYLKALYMDTVAYHAPAIMCACQTVGAKRLLFGSDAPPLLPLLPRAKRIIEELPISAAEREDIFANNALKLLRRD